MRTIRLSELALCCEGRLIGTDISIKRISTDSREALQGAIFVALKGERFDAHDFIAEAESNGAAALLMHRNIETNLPHILCADTEEALGEIAAGLAKNRPAVVLALTGSNGKTSVKNLLHSILAVAGNAYVNPGNRNNEIGRQITWAFAQKDMSAKVNLLGL